MRSARAIIIGGGYLGLRVAAILAQQDVAVLATSRSRDRWDSFAELRVATRMFDITSDDLERLVPENWLLGPIDVYFMLPPSRVAPALQAGGGFERLLATLSAWPVRRATLVSSTSAYGDSTETVSAESPAMPSSERAARVVAIEDRWFAAGERFFGCRLAGLYGPGRLIGRKKLSNGEAFAGSATQWLNLIHIQDAASCVVACNQSVNANRIELGSDGAPVTRSDFYGFLAECLTLPPPKFSGSASERGGSSRRCDPSSSLGRVGWRTRYTDYRAGLSASLAEDI